MSKNMTVAVTILGDLTYTPVEGGTNVTLLNPQFTVVGAIRRAAGDDETSEQVRLQLGEESAKILAAWLNAKLQGELKGPPAVPTQTGANA